MAYATCGNQDCDSINSIQIVDKAIQTDQWNRLESGELISDKETNPMGENKGF